PAPEFEWNVKRHERGITPAMVTVAAAIPPATSSAHHLGRVPSIGPLRVNRSRSPSMNGEPTIRSGRDHVKQLAPPRGAPLDGLAFGAPVISDFLPEVRELFGESVPVYRAEPSSALVQPPRLSTPRFGWHRAHCLPTVAAGRTGLAFVRADVMAFTTRE